MNKLPKLKSPIEDIESEVIKNRALINEIYYEMNKGLAEINSALANHLLQHYETTGGIKKKIIDMMEL